MEACKSILIVEDDDDIRSVMVDVLAREGYQVTGARNGEEGLQKLRELPVPSLVFLDLMMPSMNGWQFIDVKKREPVLTPHRIVTMSAQQSEQLDADATMPKPFLLACLLSVAGKFCRGKGPKSKKELQAIS